jgi:hypothetical protein
MTLEEYRDYVQMLARKRDGEAFYNESLDHAAVIVENMFGSSRSRISILTENLIPRMFGPKEVLEKVKLFLSDPRHTLQVLYERDVSPGNPFLESIRMSANAKVRRVPEDVQEKYKFHFLVMDGDSYRYSKDKTEPSAVAAFGDKTGAANLEAIFSTLWKQSEPRAPAPVEARPPS